MTADQSQRADAKLVESWLSARSLARGLPLPVADNGALRVDTGLPGEFRRYVFVRPIAELQALAEAIDTPGIAIKLLGTDDEMRALLPDRWRLQPQATMMIGYEATADPVVPPGYQLERVRSGPTCMVQLLTESGDLAASGYAATFGDVFAYDRIVTAAAHQRLGLGRAVMAALDRERPGAARPVLVATAAGRALYLQLGWSDHCPYASATIPAASG